MARGLISNHGICHLLQVVSLHDSVAALKEKLEQCQEIRAELVTARSVESVVRITIMNDDTCCQSCPQPGHPGQGSQSGH